MGHMRVQSPVCHPPEREERCDWTAVIIVSELWFSGLSVCLNVGLWWTKRRRGGPNKCYWLSLEVYFKKNKKNCTTFAGKHAMKVCVCSAKPKSYSFDPPFIALNHHRPGCFSSGDSDITRVHYIGYFRCRTLHAAKYKSGVGLCKESHNSQLLLFFVKKV